MIPIFPASLPPELEKRPQADNLFFVQAKRFNSADAFSLHFPIKQFFLFLIFYQISRDHSMQVLTISLDQE